jgi:hypothetical protein
MPKALLCASLFLKPTMLYSSQDYLQTSAFFIFTAENRRVFSFRRAQMQTEASVVF